MQENFKTLRILAVDDNRLNLLLLAQILKSINLTMDMAEGGEEALEKFKQNEYNFIFMDVHMPVIDGFRATKQIRRLNKACVIFGLSADTSSKTKAKGLKSGMNDYLTKPISKEILINLINEYFSHCLKTI